MTYVALNALQKVLMRTTTFIALLVQLGTFERVSDNIFCWFFLVLFSVFSGII